jgi:oxygen-independent coproporphyrinogen-3 oxidase
VGIGAVSTIEGRRWRNAPQLSGYLRALDEGGRPPREVEPLGAAVRLRERVMLGLRLDEPLSLAGLEPAVDPGALDRMAGLGLARLAVGPDGLRTVSLTRRGRLLGGGVTAELIA